MIDDKRISLKEAADILGVSADTVRRWCSAGEIKFVKYPGNKGRILVSKASVMRFLTNHSHNIDR